MFRASPPPSPQTQDTDLTGFLQRRADRVQGFEPWVRFDVAAEYLGLHAQDLHELARTGEIPAQSVGSGKGTSWRFLISELDIWMRSRITGA